MFNNIKGAELLRYYKPKTLNVAFLGVKALQYIIFGCNSLGPKKLLYKFLII